MNNSNAALRPPPRPRSPPNNRSQSAISQRSASSESSAESQVNALPMKRGPYGQFQAGRPSTSGGPSASTTSLQNFSRPAARQGSIDGALRTASPAMGPSGSQIGHRARQHSQGFFEPSLPHASSTNAPGLSNLTASQIAAQAAMHHVSNVQQERRQSGSTVRPAPINTAGTVPGRRTSSPLTSPQPASSGNLPYKNGTVGGNRLAAATAANAAFPRSPLPSPNSQPAMEHPPPLAPVVASQQKESKPKERSMAKLFSKPKSIGISKDKDLDRRHPALPSPGKNVSRLGFANASTTSLVDPALSSASSFYSSANASTSTLVPSTTTASGYEKDREKHRHHFLSRQKHKLKDAPDNRNLPLSSASSNSQAVDPSAPQPLYSFTPQSPGPSSTFAKSMSGLDLRHGGRALREKKKEEKAAASAGLTPLSNVLSNSSINASFVHDRGDFLGPSSLDSTTMLGPPTASSASLFSFPTLEQTPTISQTAFNSIGLNMGLNGITADDAWPLLKARLLNIFEGEDLRTPIEDFNLLVSVHIRRCVHKRAPIVLIEDLRELLNTGFSSLGQTLRNVPDERLVPKLVEMWLTVFGSILPFIQAVFLPLDLEFKGRGPIMGAREAAEFWGAMPETFRADERPSSSGGTIKLPSLGEELDVRRITLITFRDAVILPRHETLMAIFSRLSLDSINAGPTADPSNASSRSRGHSNAAAGAERPGTGGSLSPRLSSFNSQGSTLLDAASSSSGGAISHTHSRSRAASNTSAGSFGTSLPHLPSPLSSQVPTSVPQHGPPMTDPTQVTETVARMLQCVSVLAGVQTGDQGQSVIEKLTGALKYNWLGRGRTGRQRRGWVGMRVGGRTGVVGA